MILNYTFEMNVLPGSRLVGSKLKDTFLRKKYAVKILRIRRAKKVYTKSFSHVVLHEGDLITAQAPEDVLANLESEPGIAIHIDKFVKNELPTETFRMVIPLGSRYIQKTIDQVGIFKNDNVVVAAIYKGQKKITSLIRSAKLGLGDMLLIKTTTEHADKLLKDSNLLLIEQLERSYRKSKRFLALAIVIGVVVVASLGIYPILVTSLVGVILMFTAGIITPKEAYVAIRWDVIFLLAGLIPLGIALEKSGAASLIAQYISSAVVHLPTLWVLIGFYVFTTILTEILSNNASVILLVPIGIDLAIRLGIHPYLFVLVIMFAASTSFLTPIGYKTNTMVYGTGVYRFSDFFRVGIGLNILLAIVTPILIMQAYA